MLKPVLTETTLRLVTKNWYTFAVPLKMNKNQLKELVEKTFGVNVLEVKTMVVKGKTKRSPRSRRLRELSDRKKAMFLLKEGQKIELFDIKTE